MQSETAGRRPVRIKSVPVASDVRRPASPQCRRSMNRLPARTGVAALREDQDLTGAFTGLGDELRFGRHDSAGAGGRGLRIADVEFEVGGTAPACAARSHAEVRNLPSERDMNRIVRVQDCRKHVCYVGGQALDHPFTVSDQRLWVPTKPDLSPFGQPAWSRVQDQVGASEAAVDHLRSVLQSLELALHCAGDLAEVSGGEVADVALDPCGFRSGA